MVFRSFLTIVEEISWSEYYNLLPFRQLPYAGKGIATFGVNIA